MSFLPFSATVHDLGVPLDQKLTFAPHLHHLSRDCYDQLCQLRTFGYLLMTSAATTLLQCSCLRYCTARLLFNLLYTGLPASRLSYLDRMLGSAARLIGKIPTYDHITRYMLDVLHWLHVRQRIQYSHL